MGEMLQAIEQALQLNPGGITGTWRDKPCPSRTRLALPAKLAQSLPPLFVKSSEAFDGNMGAAQGNQGKLPTLTDNLRPQE